MYLALFTVTMHEDPLLVAYLHQCPFSMGVFFSVTLTFILCPYIKKR